MQQPGSSDVGSEGCNWGSTTQVDISMGASSAFGAGQCSTCWSSEIHDLQSFDAWVFDCHLHLLLFFHVLHIKASFFTKDANNRSRFMSSSVAND
jgi:hypothetical protein